MTSNLVLFFLLIFKLYSSCRKYIKGFIMRLLQVWCVEHPWSSDPLIPVLFLQEPPSAHISFTQWSLGVKQGECGSTRFSDKHLPRC